MARMTKLYLILFSLVTLLIAEKVGNAELRALIKDGKIFLAVAQKLAVQPHKPVTFYLWAQRARDHQQRVRDLQVPDL